MTAPPSAAPASLRADAGTDLSPDDAVLLARYLDHVRIEKRLAERTCTLYALDLSKLATFAAQAHLPLRQVQTHHIRQWITRMHASGRSGRGIALILSGWRGFYTWLGREGLVSANPVQDVRAPRQSRPLPKALEIDVAMQLAEHMHQPPTDDTDPWLLARDAAMVELLYGCGLRVGELTGLDILATDAGLRAGRGWIDLDGTEVHVQGKGSKRRSLPLGAPALTALRHWLSVREQGLQKPCADADAARALFIGRHGTRLTAQSIWQRLRRAGQHAGLNTPVHPHMLRHSCASHMLQSSHDLRGVQEMLGHAHIATTQVYTRLDFQHLAATYDNAHPRAKRKA